MIRIIDCSHWQGNIDWARTNVDVAILKVTEGTNFLDNKFSRNKSECRRLGILLGYYHFANGGDAVKEADWFVKNVGDIKNGELLVLDFEINIGGSGNWCKKFLDRVYQKTRIKPLLYTNESRVKSIDWQEVVAGNYGLWVAKYASSSIYVPHQLQRTPTSGQWKFWAMWQYSSKGTVPGITGNVDMNYTKMDLGTLKKYGKVEADEVSDVPPVEVAYTPYSQKDSRWKNIKLGFGNYTIGSDGCFLTCLSMMVNKTPDVVNEILKKAGAFSGSMMISNKAAKALGLQLLQGNSNLPGKMTDINYMPDWSPTIKEVDYNSKTAVNDQHFVLRIIENGTRYIIDPLDAKKKHINYYPKFISYRLFKK